jgi:hypothetical protein
MVGLGQPEPSGTSYHFQEETDVFPNARGLAVIVCSAWSIPALFFLQGIWQALFGIFLISMKKIEALRV